MGEVGVVVFLLGGWTLAPKRKIENWIFFFFFSFFPTVFFLSFFFLSFFLLLFFLSSLSDVVFTGGRQSRVFLRGI